MWEIEDNKITIAGIPLTSKSAPPEELVCYIRGITCTRVWVSKSALKYIIKHTKKSYNKVDIHIDWDKGYPLVTHIDFPLSPKYY